MSVIDEVAAPKMMEEWEHDRCASEAREVWLGIRTLLQQIRAEVGEPPRSLKGSVAAQISKRADGVPEVQLYNPNLVVAGQGRCFCEAFVDLSYAYKGVLESILVHHDWSLLPSPDRSLSTLIDVVKSGIYFSVLRFLSERIPIENARMASDAMQTFALVM